nr:TRAFs-binding domain-containing protein [Nitrosomonas sp.]
MQPHAFVAMPFGTKKDSQGNLIDFNRVYRELIQPALRAAGLQPFRADEEHRAGDIRTDMFQELLLADLVIADITIDNPNVWYELGIRHGLRARGVVLICGGEISTAFDLYTDRKFRYHIKAEGPDPLLVGADIQNLTEMVKATMQSWHGRKTSPVYQLLPHLQEPDWKSLRIGGIQEYWEKYQAWENRIKLAVNAGYLGDVLVLADEAPVAALRAEAWIKAGKALRQHEHFHFALDQLERGLAIEPDNLLGLHEKGICLQRLAQRNESGYSLDRARTHYQSILSQESYQHDAETWALLGRIDKDAWYSAWYQPNQTTQSYRDEAAYQSPLLKNAIESYRTAYRSNPSHYYSGINALTLMYLYEDLTHDTRYHAEMSAMAGAIRFAAFVEAETQPSFWPQATLGDLEILVGTPETVKAAYKEAI